MKRIIALALALLMLLSFVGCSEKAEDEDERTDAAVNVDELIEDLGEITLESVSAVAAAEEAYNALTEDERDSLENERDLKKAREKLNGLLVDNAKLKIASIGTVSINDYSSLTDARNTYDSLPDSLKSSVDNYTDLEYAEDSFRRSFIVPVEDAIRAIDFDGDISEADLEFARDMIAELPEELRPLVRNYSALEETEKRIAKEKSDKVIALIDEIGEVNYASSYAIAPARSAYDALTDDIKALVTNYSVLTAAEENYLILKGSIDYTALVSRLRIETDGNTWVESLAQPEYIDSESFFFPYIGYNTSSSWLRLLFNYYPADFEYSSIDLIADGETVGFKVDLSELHILANGDVSVIYADLAGDNGDMEFLWKLAYSDSAVIRFNADFNRFEFELGAEEKSGIIDVLLYYETLQTGTI